MARHIIPNMNRQFVKQLIKQHLQVSRDHLTPELGLYLITSKSSLWKAKPDEVPFDDPFWAFYWPGGQALTRYILDKPSIVKDKRVLDLGCGCGSVSIAAKLCGAQHVLANDINPVAIVASELNMEMNSASTYTDTRNLLTARDKSHFDVVFMGDMFYDQCFAATISKWLGKLPSDTSIYIGDPGRITFNTSSLKESLHCEAEYTLGASCQMENNGLTNAAVWRFARK